MNILNDTEQLPVIPVDSTDLYNVELEYLEDELSNLYRSRLMRF